MRSDHPLEKRNIKKMHQDLKDSLAVIFKKHVQLKQFLQGPTLQRQNIRQPILPKIPTTKVKRQG